MVKDALGREWQLGTIQVDYNLPERFDLKYIDKNNESQRPVMIHRAPFGSLERFVGVLIEHCGGNFPLWLSPVQIAVLPISERFNDYAQQVIEALKLKDIRGFVDDRDEKIGRKIRDAEVTKVPYMLIIGGKEQETGQVAVRHRLLGMKGACSLEEFIAQLKKEELDKRTLETEVSD